MEVIHLNGFVYKSFYRFNLCFVVVFKRKRIVSNRVIRPSQSQITSTGVQQLVKEISVREVPVYPRPYHRCAWGSWREIHHVLTGDLVDRD